MKVFLAVLLAGVTAGLTMLVRIPIPGTGGYLNIGDMAVVFCGLFLGGKWGGAAGGIGSAVADLVGGFFVFSPVTLVAKGLEGLIAGTLGKQHPLWVGLGSLCMVAVYFVAEVFIPNIGFTAALSELPFNLIQAAVGAIGGLSVYKAVTLALPQVRTAQGGGNGTPK